MQNQLTLFICLLKFMEMLWSYKKCQKIGVGRGLGRVGMKYLIPQTIPDKIFGTKWSNPRDVSRLNLIVVDHYECPKKYTQKCFMQQKLIHHFHAKTGNTIQTSKASSL